MLMEMETWCLKFKMKKDKIIVFRGKKIRRILHNGEWFFSVVDIVGILTGSTIPKRYWSDLKIKLIEEGFELYDKIVRLKLKSFDGKKYLTDCVNLKGIFRVIQSIPSKKAEPLKKWLAKVGFERVQEIENPELAQNRARGYYEKKGYPRNWIEKRMRGIAIRQDLTKEWKQRNIEKNGEYAILTNEISQATFGIPIKEHKRIKRLNFNLENENLRDHLTDLELIFSMLGEKVTTEITKEEDLLGFNECFDAGIRGGNVAGKARLDAEREIGKKIVSSKNVLDLIEKKKNKKIEEILNEK